MVRRLVVLAMSVLLAGTLPAADELPLLGITHVAFRVSDLVTARDFYGRVLGFGEPFEFRDGDRTTVAFMKINDRQYIELYPGLPPGEAPRFSHVCLETSDIESVRKRLVERGLDPTPIIKARAGNLLCSVKDPDGQMIEFLEYLPGSMHRNAEGKVLSPNRISTRLMHAAVMARNEAASMVFYRDKLGFKESWRGGNQDGETRWINMRIPGERGDYIELMLYRGQPTRREVGGMQHVCLEAPNVPAARKVLLARGFGEPDRFQARFGRNNRWQLNLWDPDETRVELMEPRDVVRPHIDRWRRVADRLLTTPAESYAFNWGEGVQMIGMMKIHERVHDEAYADYVRKWAHPYVHKNIRSLLSLDDPGAKLPGYCGHWSPATAFLYLYQARKQPAHLRLAEQVNDFILHGAERSPEGALSHWIGNHQLWVDTLYMACPLLAGLGKMQNKPEWINAAAEQIILYSKELQDSETGLFYHMRDWKTGRRTDDLWARGNGWALMSLADTIEVMDRRHKHYAALTSVASRLAEGLARTQDKDGMWHTIMDDPGSYPESSATSMLCYGLLKLARLGVLSDSVHPMAQRAWSVLNEKYVQDGIVTGVSAGTIPRDRKFYTNVPLGSQTWGTGAYLMAGSEVFR
jgi:rhamnogalacturonyl hydrolase YesR